MASCADVRSGKLMPGLLITLLFLLTSIFPIKARGNILLTIAKGWGVGN